MQSLEFSVVGTLLGTAIGDAMGLPYEGLTRERQRVLYPRIKGHRLILRKGMTSDDTEHTCLVAQSLIASSGNVEKFQREFARRLRFWLLGLPAGIGLATLRAICRLWVGLPPSQSGVFSAGNGPVMRVALFGVCFGQQPELLRQMVRGSTRITHTDPKAEYGAMAVALAAYLASGKCDVSGDEYLQLLHDRLPVEADEFLALIKLSVESVHAGESALEFANAIGCRGGVSGYVYQTVPVVIQTWLRHQADYLNGVLEMISLGGDTDTTAAILGGIIGARVGKAGIPQLWLTDLREWPRSVSWMERLGRRLVQVLEGDAQPALPVFAPGLILRNLLFLAVVLLHGLRHCLPPYR